MAALIMSAGLEARVVDSPAGRVEGVTLDGIDRYLGIPYAAPPVGALRWAPPEPAAYWGRPYPATAFGAACMQAITPGGWGPYTSEFLASGPVSEDCLTLNIWAPQDSRGAGKKPVILWIHGGGYGSGASSVPIYDGAGLARRGVVVVSINYRLGVFGYLATAGMGAGAGNFGVLDTIAALTWLRRNITAFGGDPANVTIAGQSAGGGMVGVLLAAPAARGLFRHAIIQSAPIGGMPNIDRAVAEATGAALLAALHVPSIAAARALDPMVVMKAAAALSVPAHGSMPPMLFAPVVDGVVLPRSVDAALGQGQLADVPVLAGFNAGDPLVVAKTVAAYRAALEQRYGGHAGLFISAYLPKRDADVAAAAVKEGRDRLKTGMIRWSNLHAGRGFAPLYLYYFDQALPGPGMDQWGAFHTAEVPYLFGTVGVNAQRIMSRDDTMVAADLQQRWVAFARTGNPNDRNPNDHGAHAWAPSGTHVVLEKLDARGGTEPLPSPAIRALFRRYYAAGGKPDLF